jgi:hypothetical protein
MSTTTRRGALRGASIAGLLSIPTIALAAQSSKSNPDEELIRVCHRFAESQLEDWCRYVVEVDTDEDDAPVPWDDYHRIVGTQATTPVGWHAKALAFTAWSRESYDDHQDDRDSHTTFLAALLRDMVAPARNAIIAGCTAKYGPLPTQYTAEGIWIGYSVEERAEIDAENAAGVAAREAEREAKHKATMTEMMRSHTVETMTREELAAALPGYLKMRDIADSLHKDALERLAGMAA